VQPISSTTCELQLIAGPSIRNEIHKKHSSYVLTNRLLKPCIEKLVRNHEVKKSTISWEIKPCSPLKVNQRFGGTYHLHLHGRVSRVRYQFKSRWQADILLDLFDPEDVGATYLGNVG
jgi:hypothetical protein